MKSWGSKPDKDGKAVSGSFYSDKQSRHISRICEEKIYQITPGLIDKGFEYRGFPEKLTECQDLMGYLKRSIKGRIWFWLKIGGLAIGGVAGLIWLLINLAVEGKIPL